MAERERRGLGWLAARPVPLWLALFVSHVLVFAVPVTLLEAGTLLSEGLDQARHEGLARQAELVALLLAPALAACAPACPPGTPDPALIAEIATRTHAGVRLISPDGRVTASNGPRLGDDLSDRPEVEAALSGVSGLAHRAVPPGASAEQLPARESLAIQRIWLYAASPIRSGLPADNRVISAVLLTRPSRHDATEILLLLERTAQPAFLSGTLVLLLALAFSWRLSRSLHALAAAVRPLAEGRRHDLSPLDHTRVAEVRVLARTFAEVTRRLHAQLDHNRDFAANVAHEFKTPITTLRGTVELFAEEPDLPLPPDQRARLLDNARTDLSRLERMVQGLLDLARAEAARPTGTVDLDDLLAATGLPVTGAAGTVPGDPRLLDTALRNLLDNADRYGEPPITLRAARAPGADGTEWAIIEVTDAGPGVSPANLPHIFDRFFTTGHDRDGTGLGLPLVQAIARAHGGDVSVDSSPGRTTFTLRLRS